MRLATLLFAGLRVGELCELRWRDVERANARLQKRGEVPLTDGLSPHKLRHSYASLLVSLGVDPGAVMYQLGTPTPQPPITTTFPQSRRADSNR